MRVPFFLGIAAAITLASILIIAALLGFESWLAKRDRRVFRAGAEWKANAIIARLASAENDEAEYDRLAAEALLHDVGLTREIDA